MAECDVLLGMDVLGNAQTTTFDWYGRQLIMETETGRVRMLWFEQLQTQIAKLSKD